MFKKIGKNALMGDFTNLIISKEQSISTPDDGAQSPADEEKVNIEIKDFEQI